MIRRTLKELPTKKFDIRATFFSGSTISKIYSFFMQFITALSLIAIIGYDKAIPINLGMPQIYKKIEILTIFFFLADLAIKGVMSYEEKDQQKHSIARFVFHPLRIADVFAIIPYGFLPYPYRLAILVARIIKGASYSKSIKEVLAGLKEKTFEISTVFIIFTFSILSSSIIIFVAEEGKNPNIKNIFDALWWSIVTFTTVGYGDITPQTTIGRVVASFLMIMGISGIALLTGIISSAFTDRILKLKLSMEEIMEKKIKNLTNHFIICGYGRVGKVVAKEMERFKKPFVVVEENQERAKEAINEGYLTIIGSATDEEVLKKARVKEAQGIALVMDTDADNLYALITAKDENRNILAVARANSEDSVKKFIKLGAKTISPYQSSGYDISRMLISPRTAEFVSIVMQSDRTIEMGEFYITKDSPYAGKKIKDTDIRSNYNLIIIAIISKNKETIFNPKANDIIEVGSTLICVGTKEDMERFQEAIP
ncbi:NAD-binding protein [Hippea jasoniae]|uniref:NAD-binding protein n=1 Tax=Hippea jasoniae TaxID=944479 RepID=UPI00054F64F9|nr:NAD-binding protein [Hippea jasoniae]